MISAITVKGFRGIREGSLDGLSPLTILVGPNGSGKSTILEAILVCGSPSPNDALERAVRRRSQIPQGKRWLEWRGESNPWNQIAVSTHAGELRFGFGDRLRVTQVTAQQITNTGNFHGTPWWQAGQNGAPSEIRLNDPGQSPGEPPLHQMYSETVKQGRRDANAALELIRTILPTVKSIEILTEGNEPVIHLVYDDRSVPAALSGDGVHSLLRLCLSLSAPPKATVLLEEPEVHKHPAAVWQSVRAIWAAVRRGVQVILSTHSLELIDALLSEATEDDLKKMSLYSLRLDDGVLKSVRRNGEEISFARGTIENDLR